MATGSKDETTNVGRRKFLKVAAVSAATAAGFLATATFNAKEGVKSSDSTKGLGKGYGEGASLVATCGMSYSCGGGGGQCGMSYTCRGGGGTCGMSYSCSGS
ncbi:MAG: hypothetical protein LBF86_06905 [Helicobacteraceae bacterium]|nr:hypothetical protein [Helicobacteraceae bacterium]